MVGNMLRSLSTFLCLSFIVCAALEKPEEKKSRVLKNDPLSEQTHFEGEEHNVDYDHEAFLGDEAKDFDQLTPDESKRRLGIIVEKIDDDGDGFVDHDELRRWIDHTQRKYIMDDVKNQWKMNNPENKENLPWDDYRAITYGFMDEMDKNELEKDEEGHGYLDMQRRDKRRWDYADLDKDNALSLEEFTNFLHPEESTHMRNLVVTETIEDIDKDKDGKISKDEYIGDMYKGEGDEDEEPTWVANEREQFEKFRDKDKDGFLTINEVREWINPSDYDHSDAEAKHLIFEADSDKDEKLTKEEILDKYDIFVGSQATDFGEALVNHDEF